MWSTARIFSGDARSPDTTLHRTYANRRKNQEIRIKPRPLKLKPFADANF
jgi:hypothetical protein